MVEGEDYLIGRGCGWAYGKAVDGLDRFDELGLAAKASFIAIVPRGPLVGAVHYGRKIKHHYLGTPGQDSRTPEGALVKEVEE